MPSWSAPAWTPDATKPDYESVGAAAAHARAIHCRTSSCQALITIHRLIEITQYLEGDQNGTPLIGNRPYVAGRRLDQVLLDHPALFRPVCAMGVKLLQRFHITPDTYEFVVPVQLLISSVDMDLRDHGHCAEDFIAALPRDPANDQVRINARDLCADDDMNHHRPAAACAILVRGVHEQH